MDPAFQSAITNLQSAIEFLLYGRSASNLGKNLADGLGKWTVDGATTGALVTSAAKTFGHVSDVEFAFAAQADAVSPVGQLAEERRHFYSADRKNVVHQSFAIFFDGGAAFHLLVRYPGVADVAFHAQVAQSFSQ